MLVGYDDYDHVNDLGKRRCLKGYVVNIGGYVISCKACLHATIALSTTEVEYRLFLKIVSKLLD